MRENTDLIRSASNHEQTAEWTIKQPKLLSRKQEAYSHLSGLAFFYGGKVAQKCASFVRSDGVWQLENH